jgi:hypothetical protein
LRRPSSRRALPHGWRISCAGRRRSVLGAPLPLWESLTIAWPQMISLAAGTIVLFVAGYVAFQRQEVRA